MDTSLSIKPAANATQLNAPRAESVPVRESVRAELPAAKSVTASPDTTPVRNDSPRPQQPYSREVVIDPQTREVLFRVVDARSRRVVRQVPDEALMRLRAYTRALANGESPQQAQRTASIDTSV